MNAVLPEGRAGHVLALGLLAVLGVVVWLAVAAPLLGWYASRADALGDQRALQARMHALAAQLPALEQQASQTGQTATPPDAFLNDATDAIAGADLEERVQALATNAGATLSSAEALDPEPDGPYRRIELHVAVSAPWPVLIRLLQSITTGAPAMLVDDLDLTGAQIGDASLNATFTVIAFRATS